LTPGLDILRWYVEMGGDRATLGSDAHQPKFVGADFAEALDVAKAAGLTHLAYFEKRRVRMVAIV
ncbi:MAG: hypothetical protein HY784_16660, partial [Chloroflexi bacterium]|nr:hypothetical protein [Chloroflexota bacterium]